MRSLYSIVVRLFSLLLPLIGKFSPKLGKFVSGRKDVFTRLNAEIANSDRVIWFHAASLGEYEQGVPVMEEVKKLFPNHKLLLTFFSPSGYEIKKNNDLADVTLYLPLDTLKNARKFIKAAHPDLAFFIKYEFWPNYLEELKKNKIDTFLISGVFRENQPFFKWYGKWMIDSLKTFNHFFVQDQDSLELIKKLEFGNVTKSGDTRFDRVSKQLGYDNKLPFLEEFINGKSCLVCGSTWPEDDDLLVAFINESAVKKDIKVVIAPHEINTQKIEELKSKLKVQTVLYSRKEEEDLKSFSVLILDTIGLLTRTYHYADVAYVGGAAGNTGLHNILEPATFGIPIVTGTQLDKFPEAIKLRQLAGLYTVSTSEEASVLLNKFFDNKSFRQKTGMITGHFVQSNTGATEAVLDYLKIIL